MFPSISPGVPADLSPRLAYPAIYANAIRLVSFSSTPGLPNVPTCLSQVVPLPPSSPLTLHHSEFPSKFSTFSTRLSSGTAIPRSEFSREFFAISETQRERKTEREREGIVLAVTVHRQERRRVWKWTSRRDTEEGGWWWKRRKKKEENRAKEGEAFRILRRNVNQACQGSGTASMPAGVR